jgi:AcrR family transcriptional regulator
MSKHTMGARSQAPAAEEIELSRRRILEKALEKFKTLGYAKTTMDEIAAELGMSKKTLYKFFATKHDLMEELVQQNLDYLDERCDAVLASPLSAIEKLAGVSRVIVDQQQRLATKVMMGSIRDHLPHIWRRIEAFRRERKRKNMDSIIRQGIREGTFRAGIDREMFDHFLSGAISEGIHPEVLIHAHYSMGDAFLGLMDIFMNGILTENGRRQYKKVMARAKM